MNHFFDFDSAQSLWIERTQFVLKKDVENDSRIEHHEFGIVHLFFSEVSLALQEV